MKARRSSLSSPIGKIIKREKNWSDGKSPEIDFNHPKYVSISSEGIPAKEKPKESPPNSADLKHLSSEIYRTISILHKEDFFL